MTIWIDADSCPSAVRNHASKIANNNNIEINFVANKEISVSEGLHRNMIICEQVKDSADNYILEHTQKYDLVITKDIIFAQKLVEKGICTINDRGTKFTDDSIKKLNSKSSLDMQLEAIGLVKHYNEGYDRKKFALFANCFDRELQKLLKEEKTTLLRQE
ncbi:MAG: DUF188 domain-containing protein [Spirochaetales bacterium]|nr:DUF188 domain-containing protein [Spirochaetales bacterium]